MLIRSIKSSLGRYVAIMAIVALGVGFFAGLKSSMPAMTAAAGEYLASQRMYDYRLVSTLGFTDDDLEAFRALEGVRFAEAGYFIDAVIENNGGEEACQLLSMTEEVCVPYLTEGRMPENIGECLADSLNYSASDIGRTVVISAGNSEDTLSMLKLTQYTIVGLAKSPRYMSNQRGSTSLCSGTIESFLILQEEAFASEAYHEILLSFDFPGALYSAEYNAARDAREDEIKTLLNRRGADRYAQLRREADEELADARQQLDEGWKDYYDGEEEARAELFDAYAELQSGQKQIDNGRSRIEAGWQEVYAQRAALPDAQAQIDENRQLLDEKEAELQAGRAELEAGRAELESGEIALNLLKTGLDAAKAAVAAPFNATISGLESERNTVLASISAAENSPFPNTITLAALNARLSSINSSIQAAETARSEALAVFADRDAEIAASEAELEAGRAELEAAEAQLADGQAQIDEGRAQLDEAEAQLKEAPAMLDAAEAQLAASQAQLDEAQEKLDAGMAEYEEGKLEAERELAEGKQKLEDAEREYLDGIAEADDKLKLDLYCLTRNENSGCRTFDNDTQIVDGISNIFPVFFALIAALVCVTTMTRMINEERTQIGTLKAMGYSAGKIMRKYILYSGSAALLGCALGLLLGVTVIPYIIWYAYNILYNYIAVKPFPSPLMWSACFAVSVLGTVLVTVTACRAELSECPAELIRPKAPPSGRRILIERIAPVWNRLSFLSKVVLRNAFRHPVRVLMMIVGIGGCTALLVAGFGAKDSIAHVADFQYGEIFLYDIAANYDADETDTAVFEAADEYILCRQEAVTMHAGDLSKDSTAVCGRPEELARMYYLHDGDEEIAFPGPGEAVISVKAADTLKLQTGGSFTVGIDGESLTLTVSGIADNYLNDFFYVSSDSLEDPEMNVALLKADDSGYAEELAASLRSADGVSYVTLMDSEREMVEDSMASIDLIVALLVVCSGALAFITLYNLTNINIMERTREVATVRVLGFRRNETAAYILRENVLLSLLGAVFGLLLGNVFLKVVISMVQVEFMSFDTRVAPLSYVVSFAITMVFAVLANRSMYPKLEAVNMAEALKSVE